MEESKWCKREIETFVANRGKENVLLVLADGEPDTSFPKIIYDGTTEPLAADVRGNTNRERLKNLKVEKLRVLAQMLRVDFDSLKQRQKERKVKTILTAVSTAAVIAFAFAALAVTSAIKINKQANQLAYDKSIQMASESARLLSDDKRLQALKIASEALTSSDNVAMPYTPEAQYALVDALRIYDSAKYSKAVLEIDTNGTICAMEFNANPFEVIFADRSGNVAIWLYQEYDKIFETNDGIKDSDSENIVGFIDSDHFYYINANGEIVISSINNSADGNIILNDADFIGVYINDSHDKLAAQSGSELYVYDLADFSVLYNDSLEDESTHKYADCIGWDDSDNLIMYSVCSIDNTTREELIVADIAEDSVIMNAQFAESQMKDCLCNDGVFYVLSKRTDGDLSRSFVCALDPQNAEAKWNSLFNGTAGEVYITSSDSLAVTAGNDVYLYNCKDGSLIGNYSFNANIGCLTEHDGSLYVRNLNGESSVIVSSNGAYSYLGKLIECTNLSKLKSLEITKYNYAYMGIAANGNDNHLIFYNYMVNDFATPYDADMFACDFEIEYDTEAYQIAKDLGADASNTIYSIVTDNDNELSVISYKNGYVSVYDNNKKEIAYSRSIGTVIDNYMGEDIHGNKYFGNDSQAIMISPAHEVIASIEDMVGLSSDRTGVLMQSFDEQRRPTLLKYDIYDKETLLETTAFKMDYYHYE